jgi:uncharacterized protein YggE
MPGSFLPDKHGRRWIAGEAGSSVRCLDFEATGHSINPMYDFVNGKREYRGTQVSRRFTARLRDMDTFNAWSEALVKAGVQDVPGVVVNVDGRDKKEAELRITALRNARAEATRLAAALDQVVTGVYTISDTPIGEGGGMRLRMAAKDAGQHQAPTLPDTVELTVQAYAVFTMMAKQGLMRRTACTR